MYAIMGVTGQIGSVIGRTLLAAEQPIRAVVRDAGKAQVWADRGCEIALANIEDTASLTTAFRGVEGVFVLVPPNFDPAPEFPEARAIAAALRTALEAARPARVVYLSTIGAQAIQSNLLTQHTIIEMTLDKKVVWTYDSRTMNGNKGQMQMRCMLVPAFNRVASSPWFCWVFCVSSRRFVFSLSGLFDVRRRI